MTQQELVQQIRAKNPQYQSLPDNVLLNFAIKQKPELKSQVKDLNISSPAQQRTEQARQLITETAGQQQDNSHPLRDFGVGFVKSAGRSIVDMAKTAPEVASIATNPVQYGINKITGNDSLLQKSSKKLFESKEAKKVEEVLQPKNEMQKMGGYAETATELLTGGAVTKQATKATRYLSKAENALSMNLPELKNIGNKTFKKIFNIDKKELENVGGVITNQVKKMPEKVKSLANDFKDILQGSPTENLKNVKKAKSEMWNATLNLFNDVNKSLNKNQIASAIKKSIEKKIAFDSPMQKQEVLDKTIKPFMEKIKTGTLRGLEEARGKLSLESRDVSGNLKKANEILHDAVKNYLREQLPEEKKILYDSLKKTHAKLFDVQEILKAKNNASGTSLAKKAGGTLKNALIGAGIAGGAVSIYKSIFK